MTTTTGTEAEPTMAPTTFTEALVRLAHLVDQVFGDVSRERGLTSQQAQLLCLLIEEPVGMTRLSRLLHLEKSSLTGLVDRVERRGLVVRVRDGADRRACRIALTDEGVRQGNETHDEVTLRLEQLAEELPAADRKRLIAVVAEMSAGISP